MIYLDYAANTPADPEILRFFCEKEASLIGNGNAAHRAGRETAALLEETAANAAELLGCAPGEILFTSGATEGNNLALKGMTADVLGGQIILSPLEHASVREPAEYLKKRGFTVAYLSLNRDGTVDLDHLAELLKRETALVAVAAVDSELGVVQPVAEIAALVKERSEARFHVDATQAAGKVPLAPERIDTMTFSAHKIYGLNGSGMLYRNRRAALSPLFHGGHGAFRAGTPTAALNAAFVMALNKAQTERESRFKEVKEKNAALRAALSRYDKVSLNSPDSAVPHILNLGVEGVRGTVMRQALDGEGVCVSVRSACGSDGEPSAAVTALGGSRREALSSWRISLSHLTGEEEIASFAAAFDRCYRRLTAKA